MKEEQQRNNAIEYVAFPKPFFSFPCYLARVQVTTPWLRLRLKVRRKIELS